MRERILTLHGIWTRGDWQDEIARVFRPHFDCIAIRYQHYRWFGPICLVFEPYALLGLCFVVLALRRASLAPFITAILIALTFLIGYGASYVRRYLAFKTVVRQADQFARPDMQTRTHFIAHSLGTYLLGRILMTRNEFHIGRIILVGCVLPSRFPWLGLRAVGTDDNQRRFTQVRNDIALRDVVVCLAWMVSWLVRGLGLAGLLGFSGREEFVHNNADPTQPCSHCPSETVLIHNVQSKHLGHSGTFVSSGHAEVFWLPYLWGIDPAEYADFLRLCNAAAGLERQWSVSTRTTGYVDRRLLEVEDRLRRKVWRWSKGSFEDFVLEEVLSRYPPETEDLDELVSLAIRGVWYSVREAMEARESRENKRRLRSLEDPASEEQIAWLDPREAVRRAVGLL
jgi:pimeloyl-ACP methyl ester carboxylesterase